MKCAVFVLVLAANASAQDGGFSAWQITATNTTPGVASFRCEGNPASSSACIENPGGITEIFGTVKSETLSPTNCDVIVASRYDGGGAGGPVGRTLGNIFCAVNGETSVVQVDSVGTVSANSALRAGTYLQSGSYTWVGNGTVYLGSAAHLAVSGTTPTLSGFGTSPGVVAANGTLSFTINVGAGGDASTGTINLGASANGWNCWCNNISTLGHVEQFGTGSNSTCALTNVNLATGAASAWASGAVLKCGAVAN